MENDYKPIELAPVPVKKTQKMYEGKPLSILKVDNDFFVIDTLKSNDTP